METESHDVESGRPPYPIKGGLNEQANLRPRKKSCDQSIFKVKVQIISQSNSKCTILKPHPGTLATNGMDSNADTCFLSTNFIVVNMKERENGLYLCDNAYESMYNVPIVTCASTYMDRNTGIFFITVINEALYYGNKLGHYLISPNQLQSYKTMVWGRTF